MPPKSSSSSSASAHRAPKLLAVRDEELALAQQELAALDDRLNPNVLVNLRLVQRSTALFGRSLLQFALPTAPKPHQFTVGDLVQIRVRKRSDATPASGGRAAYPTGVVARVEETAIAVALGENEDLDEDELLTSHDTVTLDRLVNNATFAKIASALDQLAKFDCGAAQAVVDVVFSGKAPSWNPLPEIAPFTAGLNASQLEAIRFALASKDLALIHGPPGTGKTTTVVELLLQAVKTMGMKVLVCAPSNIAVDNVLEKLARADRALRLTRVGHPARLLPQVLRHCLEAKIAAADGTEIVNDIRKEMVAMQAQLSKTRDKGARFALRRDLKANRKEVRQREHKVVVELVKHSDVVFATNVGAASKLLKDATFDLVVIDEAAQALEAACWVPILKAKRCVLAGDHKQLPPTIKSKAAAADGLELTLFDRVTRLAGTQSVVKMLTTQYRMHARISDWSSRAMYDGALESFEGVATRKLHELPHVTIAADDELLNATLLLLDTAGCGLEEDRPDSESGRGGNGELAQLSKSNEGEARVVAKHVRALLHAGLQQEEIAVITPYNKQVQALKALLLDAFPKLEIRSVDGFQGCEKEAVVMSLVRSNDARQVGFLADDRRMNVAITRAKRHVAVVCDSDTIRAHKFLDALVTHFEDFGEYRSAQEYLDDDLVRGSATTVPSAALSAGATEAKPRSDAKAKATAPLPTKPPRALKAKVSASETKATTEAVAALAASNSNAEEQPTPSQLDIAQEDASAAVTAAEADDNADAASDDDAAGGDGREPTASVFQLMAGDSSSSSDEADDGDKEEEEKAAPTEIANSLLKTLHLERLGRQPPPPAPSAKKSATKKKSKKKAKGGSQATAPVDAFQDGEDELEFLARQANSSTKCSFQSAARCRKSVGVMGSVCKFCKLKFCYEHGVPEAHGCGDAVRQFERAQFQQQQLRNNKPAAAATAKPLSADKRKLLKKKLDDKVTGMTAGRTTKSKEKKA
ncbi:hypothetical protein PybrP1_000791 [[Pythium] brassicae (nom. inval.)]|nr:hypothetical protein PybrP1_000791 [[Pythium] brassicae (nom. inval.)]